MSPLRLAALSLSFVALSACATARMSVPSSLEGAERLAVSGRQGWRGWDGAQARLDYGEWTVTEIRRSAERGREWRVGLPGIPMLEVSDAAQRYSFTVRDGGNQAMRAACAAYLDVVALGARAGDDGIRAEPSSKSQLRCLLADAQDTTVRYVMDLTESGERPLSGALRRLGADGDSLRVSGTNRMERSRIPSGETVGYHLDHAGRTIAAVETMNGGALLLARDAAAPVRRLASAVAAAVLLHDELRK